MKTLKGNAIIAQSGGCTAVINQSLAGAAMAARASKTITGVWGARNGVEGILKDSLIDLSAQPAVLLRKIAETPSAALGSSRHKLKPGDDKKILANLKRRNIRYLFLIGGNDTANTSLRIARTARENRYELRVIHIPKTIDNDLMETDHCPGYGSVARFAAITTQEAALDTRAMKNVDPIKIIELMGRNSGWIVAAAALLKRSAADAPHILLIPEIPLDETALIKRTEAVMQSVGYCIIVISETIRDHGGNRIGQKTEGVTSDPFGHKYVEGTAARLASILEKNLGVRARFDKPGTIQRMSMPYISTVDQKEACQAGARAVAWALKGMSEVMVGFARKSGKRYAIEYRPVPLGRIPNNERYLPAEFFDAKHSMITPAFAEYALPLLGPGLPEFPVFK
ncbi:MAG TPA: diphosphate--fructose-6-phosphate 1-phosphotransferase [Candidatus Omnitrophota bacterium]|jgi:6-phosphofructokinase 1|nr:MAG: 6-phosphofructokinase [Candidatus Omnitrophica bacterium ADurb.Bin314]HOE68389.1 diphosphate--fructose-6-phosphate 1-phosphotransferase [Candidatus Omnitrophota bacterium]HQB94788.1 diphosphate--fructose-6-phosphate 1-phosphotransferase [Candidatus Omnitrophota bacterium]